MEEKRQEPGTITDVIGAVPYRMAFAGGWIDQPFVSKHNPDSFGSMVVVGIEPGCRFMDKCGMGTSTRNVALQVWNGRLPEGRPPGELVRELYNRENEGKEEPSGSQDMAGLIYPGINRLDYAYDREGGYFPFHVETCMDTSVVRWLEAIIWMVPVAQRPEGYNPLTMKNLKPEWIRALGRSGKDCFQAIVETDAAGLGRSMNECMQYWELILPGTVQHPALTVDLKGILSFYQKRYYGAMYSGCGGGYLYVVSDEQVPGGFQVRVRTA